MKTIFTKSDSLFRRKRGVMCVVSGRLRISAYSLICLVVGFCLFLHGCRSKPEDLKIGAIFSVTGEASFLGEAEKKTALMLADEVNKAGGVGGRRLRVIVEDDGGDVERTRGAAIKLMDVEKVLAIIGPSRSGNTLEVMKMAAERGVPVVSCAAAEAIVSPGNDWVFKTPQRDVFLVELILRQIYRDGVTGIGVLYEDTSFGREGLRHIEGLRSKYGIEVVYAGKVGKGADGKDIVRMVSEMKSRKGVGAVLGWSILPAMALVPGVMKDEGMGDARFYVTQASMNERFLREAGRAAEDVVFPGGKLLIVDQLPDGDQQKKVLLAFKNMYEKRYGERASIAGGHAYDAFYLVADALRSGGADRGRIRDGIESRQNFTGIGGVFNMSRQDHNGLSIDSLEMLTVRDGRFVLLRSLKK